MPPHKSRATDEFAHGALVHQERYQREQMQMVTTQNPTDDAANPGNSDEAPEN